MVMTFELLSQAIVGSGCHTGYSSAPAPVTGSLKVIDAMVSLLRVKLAGTVETTLGAWGLHRAKFRGARTLQTLVGIPIMMPEIVMGVSLLALFGSAIYVAIELGRDGRRVRSR